MYEVVLNENNFEEEVLKSDIPVLVGISSIPTLKVFVNGEVVRSSVGVQPKSAIEAMLA